MAKKKAKKKGGPKLPPLTMLRPRLDTALSRPDWVDVELTEAAEQLTAMTTNIPVADFLPVFAKARQAAAPAVQIKLDLLMVAWLQEQGLIDEVQAVVEQDGLVEDDLPVVLDWLAAAGVDTRTLIRDMENFCVGYRAVDAFPSQGILILLWFVDRRQTRVAGVNFLLDFNPPWEGCIKDVLPLSQVDRAAVHRESLAVWEEQGLVFEELDRAKAKQAFVDLLMVNREQGIRLHEDISAYRGDLIRHVLNLPDGAETPPFTTEDFDYVINNGRPAEGIMRYEQTIGRRVRLDDGSELLVQGGDWGDDEWDDDEWDDDE